MKVIIDGIEYTPKIQSDGRKPFGELVADARRQANMSLDDVAVSVGVSKGQVWQLEQGKIDPRLSTVKKFLRYYGLSFDDIE